MDTQNIKYLNRTKLSQKVLKLNDEYWNKTWEGRWKYMYPVTKELINLQPKTILELGAYKINLTNISDNMDLEYDFIDPDNLNNKTYIQDATKLPWDIPDKYYDVVIALQIFEHFENNKQSEVFKEIMRVSKNAILSFPFKWNLPTNIYHHNLDNDVFEKWTNNVKPTTIKYINVPLVRKRVIYIYNFI